MKTEPSTAARSLRAVGLAITLVSIVTFASVVYSAYAIFSGVQSLAMTGSHAVQAKSTIQGSSATIDVNATIPNKGLLPLDVSASCSGLAAGITCTQASLTIAPSTEGTFNFKVHIANATEFETNLTNEHINGTIRVELVPFASLSVSIDIARFLSSSGG